MRLLYTFSILAYAFIVKMLAPFHSKAGKWVDGRKNQQIFDTQRHGHSKQWIWFHAASLGEFEQGRPLIEAIKSHFPDKKILLTFFSPSGYEIRKNYELADMVAYMPVDTKANALKIVNAIKPAMVFFIKYEFWFNTMQTLHKNQIPMYFVSSRFRPGQHFFRWYGGWFRKQLGLVNRFFLQDAASAQLLQSIGIKNHTVVGDTRFDRVYRMSAQAKPILDVEAFLAGRKAFVVGSSWPADEEKLVAAIQSLPDNYVVVMAPHDISQKHLKAIEAQLPVGCIRYSVLQPESQARVLLIDNIGMLQRLYRYADFAYVGGGFGQNIHNIQEAVAYGCPVIVGPKHKNFTEAVELIRLGGAFAVNDANALTDLVARLVNDRPFREKASRVCLQYVQASIGATERVMQSVFPAYTAE